MSPTKDEFLKYFRDNSLRDHEIRMLLLHYFSPSHTITSGQLAAAMEWANFNGINLHYGGLAHAVGSALGYPQPDNGIWVTLFADFHKPEDDGQDKKRWQWIMRDELVATIVEMGWATPEAKEKYESELRWAQLLA